MLLNTFTEVSLRFNPLRLAGTAGLILLAGGIATALEAGQRQAVPRSGGGGYRGAAPVYRGGSPRGSAPVRTQPAPRATAYGRGYATPRGTANGIARYGYGSGYGYGYGYGGAYYGYPYWGAGCGWWGVGWYGGWWGWPGYAYAAYGPSYGPWYDEYYGPYNAGYVAAVDAPKPSGPAIVETDVTPQKASVLLDGAVVGFASDYNGRWDELSVAPGPHTVSFQLTGYRTLAIDFEASPHATYVFNDALVPGEGEDRRTIPAAAERPPDRPPPAAPSSNAIGRLRVTAVPGDAAVYLDGEYLGLGVELGRIHGALAVPAGSHRVEAVRPGYVSASRAIDVGETDVITVELVLQPAP
jgi:hypothetical protein